SGPEHTEQAATLKFVCPSVLPVLVEAWGVLGPDGAARLKQVIDYPRSNENLRLECLKQDVIAKDKRYLLDAATRNDSAAVRSLALRLLYNADDKAGVKIADSVLGTYQSGKEMAKNQPKGDVTVITALE